MAKTRTFTAMLVDHSGSMNAIREEAEGGVRGFVDELKKSDKIKARLLQYQFDSKYEHVWGPGKAADAPEYRLMPRGMTALYDAVGNIIEDTKVAIDSLPEGEKPEKIVVVLMTDGQENSSKEFTFEAVQKLIAARQADGWEFIFLAGTLEAKQFGQASGIGSTVSFDPTRRGQTKGVYNAASSATMDFYEGRTRGIKVPDKVEDASDDDK